MRASLRGVGRVVLFFFLSFFVGSGDLSYAHTHTHILITWFVLRESVIETNSCPPINQPTWGGNLLTNKFRCGKVHGLVDWMLSDERSIALNWSLFSLWKWCVCVTREKITSPRFRFLRKMFETEVKTSWITNHVEIVGNVFQLFGAIVVFLIN